MGTRLPEFQDERRHAAPPRRVIHLYWVYAQAGKTQLLYRHPDSMDSLKRFRLGQDASPRLGPVHGVGSFIHRRRFVWRSNRHLVDIHSTDRFNVGACRLLIPALS